MRKTWKSVAEHIGISVRQLLEWRAKPGAPTSKELDEWSAFADELRGASGDAEYWAYLPGECQYDEAFRHGYSEKRAIDRERVRGLEITNMREDLAAKREEKSLIPMEHADRMAAAVGDIFVAAMKGFGARILSGEKMSGAAKAGLARKIDKGVLARIQQAISNAKRATE